MKKVLVVFLCLVLAIVSSTEQDLFNTMMDMLFADAFASQVRVKVDGKNANENWIQLQVTPANTVRSIQLIAKGKTILVPNADWDHGEGSNFVAKPSSKIPYGTRCIVKAHLRSGATVELRLVWKKNSVSSSNTSKPKKNKPKKHSPPSSGASRSSVKKFISQARRYKQTGGPAAHLTGHNDLLKRNKLALNKAVASLGITDNHAKAFIFATFGLESEQMYNSDGSAQRDTGKDYDDLYKNVSPLNMNMDMLKEIGFKGDANALNKLANIKKTVQTQIMAVNKLGLQGFLNFHRGGRTGYDNPVKYEQKFKMSVYRKGMYNIMKKYLQDSKLYTDGCKVWADIPYV